jgi:hypothetical protein
VRAFEAGADAVFAPATAVDERRARMWALLRTRALFRRVERAQRTQTSEIVDRRQWLSQFLHDLKGQIGALAANVDYVAKFGPDRDDSRRADFDDSVEDAHGIFEQLKASVRTVIDYDRFESGQLVPKDERFELRDAAGEAIATLRRLAVMTERTIAFTDAAPGGRREPSLYGDRELITCAILNLGLGALRRAAPRSKLKVDIVETDVGMRFRMAAPGAPLNTGERLNIFAPYGRHAAGSVMYGLGAGAGARVDRAPGRHDLGRGSARRRRLRLRVRAGLEARARQAVAQRAAAGANVSRLGAVLGVLLLSASVAHAASGRQGRRPVQGRARRLQLQSSRAGGAGARQARRPQGRCRSLIKALADQNKTVRGIAAQALGQLGDGQASDPLRDL